MKPGSPTTRMLLKSSIHRLSAIEKAVLSILRLHEPLTVEELVSRLPEYRWGDVLMVLSQLWGDSKLELEHHEGQLKVWRLGSYEHMGDREEVTGKKTHRDLELTAL